MGHGTCESHTSSKDCGLHGDEDLPETANEVLVSEAMVGKLVDEVRSCSRVLCSSSVVSARACFVPGSPDHNPIISPLTGVENAFTAFGHGVWGILNAPATGAALASLAAAGSTDTIVDLSDFSVDRLSKP